MKNRFKKFFFEDDGSDKKAKAQAAKATEPVEETVTPAKPASIISSETAVQTAGPDEDLMELIEQALKSHEEISPAFHVFYRFYDSFTAAIPVEKTRYITALNAAEVSKDQVSFDALIASFNHHVDMVWSDQEKTLDSLKPEEDLIENMGKEVESIDESILQAQEQIKTLTETIEAKEIDKQTVLGTIEEKKIDLQNKIGSINATYEVVKKALQSKEDKCKQYLAPQPAVQPQTAAQA